MLTFAFLNYLSNYLPGKQYTSIWCLYWINLNNLLTFSNNLDTILWPFWVVIISNICNIKVWLLRKLIHCFCSYQIVSNSQVLYFNAGDCMSFWKKKQIEWWFETNFKIIMWLWKLHQVANNDPFFQNSQVAKTLKKEKQLLPGPCH